MKRKDERSVGKIYMIKEDRRPVWKQGSSPRHAWAVCVHQRGGLLGCWNEWGLASCCGVVNGAGKRAKETVRVFWFVCVGSVVY